MFVIRVALGAPSLLVVEVSAAVASETKAIVLRLLSQSFVDPRLHGRITERLGRVAPGGSEIETNQ